MSINECRICGSREIYAIETTELASNPGVSVHMAYCRECAILKEGLERDLYDLVRRIRRADDD